MSHHLTPVNPPSRLFRLGRKPDPWAWPDWSNYSDTKSGNRWDDPDRVYRVLYACSERRGAFVETLARFRPDPLIVAGRAEIIGEDDTIPPGSVPASWVENRAISDATVARTFADVGHSDSLAYLHRVLTARLVHYGIPELDGAAIRLSAPRAFTQEISRFIYKLSTVAGEPAFAGVFYQSRLGDNFHNWAIFERPYDDEIIQRRSVAPISIDDPDFQAAFDLLSLRLFEDC